MSYLLSLLTGPALACGGLFCDAAAPVDQAAEEILFAMDGGTVEMHVEITYQGQADEFGWILPVPAEPELFLSSDQIFADLSANTLPIHATTVGRVSSCNPFPGCLIPADEALLEGGGILPDPTVTVVGDQQVGPFETVTLRADSSAGLLTWLDDNGYDVPPGLDPLLAPYVAADSHFVAMRLSPEAEVGDIEPIGLRYAAQAMAIPIQLTAVAAAEDMPLRVYVLGDRRAVPESYLEVVLNPAAIDWTGLGVNYPQVLAAAVDEAGGQAFVTEFAGPTEGLTALDPITQDLFARYPYLTRLGTAISPDEMTLDPTFAYADGLPDVDNIRGAEVYSTCRHEVLNTFVILDDGQRIELGGASPFGPAPDAIADLQQITALEIWDRSTNTLLVDQTEAAEELLAEHNAAFEPAGCGCGTAPGSGWMASLLALLALGRRRRAEGCPATDPTR